jgi:cell division protein FtsB
MDDGSASRAYSAPLAVLLFCGALAVFALGYIPEARKARECEELVAEARRRISELMRQEAQARRRIAELEAGVPEAIEEAAREALRLGGGRDFLPGGG